MGDTYERFKQCAQELSDLRSILQTLNWDQEAMMPAAGGPFRARQLSTLAALYHQKLTEPAIGELLNELQDAELDLWGRSSVKEMRRQYDKAVRVPQELVRELAETTSLSYEAWVPARRESDYAAFAPWLNKVVRLKREEARCLQVSGSLYETLLDDYEPGTKTAQLDRIFSILRPKLTVLLQKIQTSALQPDPKLLDGDYPREKQEAFGREVLSAMGFDWRAGRLDTSPHPFCAGLTPRDVRITTRYSDREFTSSLFGIVHEAGHALYEQGLHPDYFGLPACDTISMGIHESQSRLWENQVARGKPFWSYWFPRLQAVFPSLDKTGFDDFVRAVNQVEASLIRVDADEVTYGLHVILRYELEKSLIHDELQVEDLEASWKAKMKEYLGVEPQRSAEGALQDMHWSHGLMGYFPTYVLGNLYAAQMYWQAQRDIPALEQSIRHGDLLPLRDWLRRQVHQHGKTLSAQELITNISGEPLSPHYFLSYLEEKFDSLYGL